jgi:transposase
MRRTELLQEVRQMRFEEAYGGWKRGRLTQEEAARILGVCDRTFRRYTQRFDDGGMEALLDKRISQASHRLAPVDEVLALAERYRKRYIGWNARHFHSHYRRDGGTRSYTWVKIRLQEARLIEKAPRRGAHRKRRERSPLPGMMIHQDGSRHEWVPGQEWDLIVTMDDATNVHYSMFFVPEEGTQSSFRGVREVLLARGIFCSLYTDRGSHYWYTPKAGGKVDKENPTQFGRAMNQLGIEMIPAYSPEARGRSERMFGTHQDRLTKELALYEITDMEAANRYLEEVYLPAFNQEFSQPPLEEGSAFVPLIGTNLNEILCEQHDRQVGHDNCVSFEGKKLQIPPDKHRCHYVKANVRVHRYDNDSMAVFHGPRRLADYNGDGKPVRDEKAMASA